MKKIQFSAADCFYDRFCQDYTLRTNAAGAVLTGNMKISSYRVEGLGNATIIRVPGALGKNTEAAVFAPLYKDAPVFMMDRVKTLVRDEMSINILDAGLTKMYYRQFSSISEDYAKIPDADCEEGWYQNLLVQGSIAKNIKGHEEAAAMLEDYIGAYIKIMEFAEKCDPEKKAEKLREFAASFAGCGSGSIATLEKAVGSEKLQEYLAHTVFAVPV